MKKYYEFYQLGNILGLTKEDIIEIIKNPIAGKEKPILTSGGPLYPGGAFYGTISINEFN